MQNIPSSCGSAGGIEAVERNPLLGQQSTCPRTGRCQKEAEAFCHQTDSGLSGGIQKKGRAAPAGEKTEYGTVRHLIFKRNRVPFLRY